MSKIAIVAAILLGLLAPIESHAWLIYHKPAFKGKIIDAQSKEPIEGAVVVAVYSKTLVAGFEPSTSTFAVRETLTGKDGVFSIEPLTTIINPFSISSFVTFIIYKPGYGDFFAYQHPGTSINNGNAIEAFFSEKFFEKEKEIKLWLMDGGGQRSFKVVFGIAELPRVGTREERLAEIHRIPGDTRFDNANALPLYFKAINEERKRFGLDEVGK